MAVHAQQVQACSDGGECDGNLHFSSVPTLHAALRIVGESSLGIALMMRRAACSVNELKWRETLMM